MAGIRGYEILTLQPKWLTFKEDRVEIDIPEDRAKRAEGDEFAVLSGVYAEDLKQFIKEVYDSRKYGN